MTEPTRREGIVSDLLKAAMIQPEPLFGQNPLKEVEAEIDRLHAAIVERDDAMAISRQANQDLAAALAEAERERDGAYEDIAKKHAIVHELQSVLKNATLETLQAIRERDAALAALAEADALWKKINTGQATRLTAQDAEAAHLRAALAEAERERDQALDRLCTAPGEGDLVTAATDMTANYVEANRRAERAEEKWRIGGAMVERAEADLAAAREIIGDLIHLAWITGPVTRSQYDFKKISQIEKAGAFLERTATSTPTPEAAKPTPTGEGASHREETPPTGGAPSGHEEPGGLGRRQAPAAIHRSDDAITPIFDEPPH